MIKQLTMAELNGVCGGANGLMAGVKDGVRIQCGQGADGVEVCNIYADNKSRLLRLSPNKPLIVKMNAAIAG